VIRRQSGRKYQPVDVLQDLDRFQAVGLIAVRMMETPDASAIKSPIGVWDKEDLGGGKCRGRNVD
jgi:hypothetical protein